MFGMFKKGGGDKNKQAAQPPPQPDVQIQYEKTLHDIRVRRDKMQDDLDRIDIKVGALDTEIRSLVSQKKQQQAKSKIAEMKGYQKQIEGLQTKYNVLTQMMIQIETQKGDSEIAQTFTQAADLAKEQQKTNDKLQDAMMDWNELKTNQAETEELWKQMSSMGVDQDELDDEFSKYEQEVTQVDAAKLTNQMNQIPAQKQPMQQQPVQFVQPQQNTNMDKELSSLLD